MKNHKYLTQHNYSLSPIYYSLSPILLQNVSDLLQFVSVLVLGYKSKKYKITSNSLKNIQKNGLEFIEKNKKYSGQKLLTAVSFFIFLRAFREL